jgi:hypothetical protein
MTCDRNINGFSVIFNWVSIPHVVQLLIWKLNEPKSIICVDIWSSAAPQLRRIASNDRFRSLMVALIHLRLGNVNLIMVELSACRQRHFQSVLNAAARQMYFFRRYTIKSPTVLTPCIVSW